jgi:ATP phosphoribosyltransferase regulatory subunit
MEYSQDVLRYDERAIMRLRTLYRQFGYAQYRMSRFEEYGLYAENKAFLPPGDIITFTGAGGKLMALRPDVTLSIVKNAVDGGGLKKLCYNENVYRLGGHEFKERIQVGLECIGDIDVYSVSEVIMLARRSLLELGERSCLEISHMGYIGGLLQSEELAPPQRSEILRRVSEKNVHELNSLCREYGLGEGFRERITALAALYGPYGETVAELRRLSVNDETDAALRELEDIRRVLGRFGDEQGIDLDFSIVNDLNYYSGVIFQGYIEGIPTKVLSGGRYDSLLQRFGKKSGAVGFAVYLDLLESAAPPRSGPGIDVLLVYGDDVGAEELAAAVNGLAADGKSVLAQRDKPGITGNSRYRQLMRLTASGLATLE